MLHQVLGIYLPLITTNCAVLGIPLLNVANRTTSVDSLLSAPAVRSVSRWCWCSSPASASLDGADVPQHFAAWPSPWLPPA